MSCRWIEASQSCVAGLTFIVAAACGAVSRQSVPLAPLSPEPEWTVHSVPESPLSVRLPPLYHKRNDYGCWHADTARSGSGQSSPDICVSLLSAAQADSVGFGRANAFDSAFKAEGGRISDEMHYSDIRVDTLALGGHRTIVERATANGGISGFYNEKLVWIRVTLRPDSVAFATGLYGDAKGLSELLGIASTITLR